MEDYDSQVYAYIQPSRCYIRELIVKENILIRIDHGIHIIVITFKLLFSF